MIDYFELGINILQSCLTDLLYCISYKYIYYMYRLSVFCPVGWVLADYLQIGALVYEINSFSEVLLHSCMQSCKLAYEQLHIVYNTVVNADLMLR